MSDIEILENTLKEILDHLGIDPEVLITENRSEDITSYNIDVKGDNLNFLIGYHGSSMSALQTMLGIILYNKTQVWHPINVDINEYKQGRANKLSEMAKRFIDKVRFFQKDVELPPMEAWERREIHTFVADYDDITSESTGEGRYRRVVLKPVNRGTPKVTVPIEKA